MVKVTAVVGILSLTRELPYAEGAAKKKKKKLEIIFGVPIVAQRVRVKILACIHEYAGSVPGCFFSGLRI